MKIRYMYQNQLMSKEEMRFRMSLTNKHLECPDDITPSEIFNREFWLGVIRDIASSTIIYVVESLLMLLVFWVITNLV